MSETQTAILAMRAAGLSYRAIGRVLGVNDSLVGQIARGAKPGRNLASRAGAAAEAVTSGRAPETVALPDAPRRQQRVRQPTQRSGARWTTGTAKRAATRSGARSLVPTIDDAAARGRRMAIRVRVRGKEIRMGAGGQGIDAETFSDLVAAHDGDVAAAAAAYAGAHAYDEGMEEGAWDELEVTTWDG